ncbi:MAG TPA: DNA double-strand break repair nuclease NurA, partial [Oculatellaceae cyanobacterium]
QKSFLERMSTAMDLFRKHRIPLIGYLSNSRATDVINMLRVALCPYDVSDCRQHCSALNEEDFPCSRIWPLSDRQLFFGSLQKGQRAPVFLSDADVTRRWEVGDRICFSYLNVGTEIARLEFPYWLFQEKDLLDRGVSVAFTQAGKGMGYPVCLSEAHHLAIIRGSERQKFFELLATHMVNLGLPKIRTSPKENRKRIGFV